MSRVRHTVRRELEGGLQERVKVDLPAVLAIQSGINEPRYVSIMGIRKASKVERKVFKAAGLSGYAYETRSTSKNGSIRRQRAGRPCSRGDMESICKELLGILKEKGVFQ